MQFPLNFTFKISSIANDFRVHDAAGVEVAYVRQKVFKLKEEVQVFNNESRSQVNFTVKATKWIDFSPTYLFFDAQGMQTGSVVRQGMKSIWRASYVICDEKGKADLSINEENAVVKVFDGIFGELPLIGILAGYFFNPTYLVTRTNGIPVVRLTKEKSFFGRRFKVDKLAEFSSTGEENRIMLGLMMMILLERHRG